MFVSACCAWRSMMRLVFADEAFVSVSLQTFPHYQRRDNCTALEGKRDRERGQRCTLERD